MYYKAANNFRFLRLIYLCGHDVKLSTLMSKITVSLSWLETDKE